MNEIKCKVTKSMEICIRAKHSDIDLKKPLYAVNWFSAKMAWVYHLYNTLASKSLKKVGGSPFFKGTITKTILDEHHSKRDLILIVHYPSATSFKNLLENTYFKIISVLRIAAVKDFSFGFTHKQIASESNLNEKLSYVIHHFKTKNRSVYMEFNTLLPEEITIKYSGKMIAELYNKKNDNKEIKVPNIMDGIVIYESKSETKILDMIARTAYQEIIKRLDSSYIGTVNRVL